MMIENARPAISTVKLNSLVSPINRIVIAIALAISLLAATLLLYPHPVQAYSCNLCHGLVIWPGNVWGAQTEDEVVSLQCVPANCKPGANYVPHIGNVLWLIDAKNNGQNCFPYGACWVEAGYHTVTNSSGNSTSNQYYWADVRPGNNNFSVHFLGNIPSGDLGKNVWLYISRNGNDSTWTVHVSPQSNYWSATSTNNTMYPSEIQMGMELLGTTGASASTGYFTYNYWQGTNSSNWNPQGNPGQTHNDSPIESNWYQLPAKNGSNHGGSFYTGCPC